MDDSTGQFSVASVGIKSIMDASNPVENIAIKPEDVISIPKADLIYAIGAVRKAHPMAPQFTRSFEVAAPRSC